MGKKKVVVLVVQNKGAARQTAASQWARCLPHAIYVHNM